MKKFIQVIADTNDADYIHSWEEITDKTIARIKPLIDAIKAFKSYKTQTEDGEMDWTHNHNFPVGECCRKDLGEKTVKEIYVDSGWVSDDILQEFEENYMPHNEFGTHTIKSIKIFEIHNEEKLL